MSVLTRMFGKKQSPTPRIIPICAVLRHTRQPGFFLQSFCRDKFAGFHRNWGYLQSLSEAEMRTNGLQVVLADLEDYSRRDSDQRVNTDSKTPQGRKDSKAMRESVQVEIELLPDGSLQCIPTSKAQRGVWTHLTDAALTLSLPSTTDRFFSRLQAAFDHCR